MLVESAVKLEEWEEKPVHGIIGVASNLSTRPGRGGC